MIKDKVQKAFNDQINEELFSSYLYLSMSAWFENRNLAGFGNWMRIQAQEEVAHVMKFYHHIVERGGEVKFQAIAGPDTEWDSPLSAFQAAYKHEQHITDRIDSLLELAMEEKDHAAQSFLKWFVDEQVEEEATADGIVQQLTLAKEAPGAMFMLDREYGQRVFTPPTAQEE